MADVLYIASLLGAVAVYLMLPGKQPKLGKVGALVGAGVLIYFLVYMYMGSASDRPTVYYYVFTFIAVVCAVRMITHVKPLYSALYFVMVVLCTSGLLVVLEAEFMAFAMVIIYAGAIIVIYLFVIMLATQPRQIGVDRDDLPIHDRIAHEPLAAVIVGFALLAMLTNSFAVSQMVLPDKAAAALQLRMDAQQLPGKFDAHKLTVMLAGKGLIESGERVVDGTFDLQSGKVDIAGVDDESDVRTISIPVDFFTTAVTNIDRIGLNLFESHTLGIELAGVILLMAMVGAVVMGRKQVINTV